MSGGLIKAQWYDDRQLLQRRIEDELYRTRRHAIEFSVLLVTFSRPLVTDVRAVLLSFRQLDFAGMLSSRDALFGLPHTGTNGAMTVWPQLSKALFSSGPLIGAATAPTDGDRVLALVTAAQKRQAKNPPNRLAATPR